LATAAEKAAALRAVRKSLHALEKRVRHRRTRGQRRCESLGTRHLRAGVELLRPPWPLGPLRSTSATWTECAWGRQRSRWFPWSRRDPLSSARRHPSLFAWSCRRSCGPRLSEYAEARSIDAPTTRNAGWTSRPPRPTGAQHAARGNRWTRHF